MLIVATNQPEPQDIRCLAFFNYPGIVITKATGMDKYQYIRQLHNGNVASGKLVVNVSPDVFVYDIDALIEFMMFLCAQENCEVNGLTSKRDTATMGDAFNILNPKTFIKEGFFTEAHDRKIDSFIAYEPAPDIDAWVLLNHAQMPFAIYSGQILGEPHKSATRDECYAWALERKGEIVEFEKDVMKLV